MYKITKLGTTNTVEYTSCKNKNATNVRVPSVVKYNGKVYKVTCIGKNAFSKNKNLLKIDFGRNIISINDKAFYKCKKLSVVKLNSKLKIIGKQAFQGCSNITLLTLPKNLQKIGDKSFYGCSKLQYIMIKSIKLTNRGIGTLSFAKCNKKVRVKTAKSKWRLYARVMITKGKLSSKATFVINPVPLIQ
ncbi:MAG: leucine-rich repeat domain-containing protein [Clostridium sp.]|nr:leucine-rich repeat domain-containing protein [Clostridium sp.]